MNPIDVIKKSNLKWLAGRTIFLTRHGSHAYGTNIATSDEDFKGLAVAPKEYYLGFSQIFNQAEFKEPDMVVFELRKFAKLAADCNPNIIEVLFSDPSDYIVCLPVAEKLLENRDLFISKKARFTFAGYAHAQLKRIEGHYRWLKHPPKAAPTRAEYGLPERTLIPADQLMAAESTINKTIQGWNLDLSGVDPDVRIGIQAQLEEFVGEVFSSKEAATQAIGRTMGLSDNFLEVLDAEKRYKSRMNEWKQYQNWKATRNEKRADLEAKFGYDTKHAMHLVRLLRMAREILTLGKVIVKRPDRDELLAIRDGAWTYEALVEWAHKQDDEMQELYDSTNVIPKAPDRNAIDKLVVDIVEELNHPSTLARRPVGPEITD